MRLIDTHCHIDAEDFAEDLEGVIQRSKDAGVQRIYLPAVDLVNMDKVVALADRYPDFIFPMMGIHPTEIDEHYKTDLAIVREWLGKRKFAAVGEIGVDLYWDKTHRKEQMLAFEEQVKMAVEFNLPVNIHVRDAFNEVFEVLERFKRNTVRGVFHCFSGSKEVAERIFRLGDFYLGIGGVVTFKNSKLGDVIKQVGIQRVVLETDAPYLSPVPLRGKRNESANLLYIANYLSELFDINPEKTGEITSQNALQLYR